MVYFVGAGPGAVDLITVRGMELLKRADLIVYAGSLVNPELLSNAEGRCSIRDSAGMTLGEIVELMAEAASAGRTVVRLHTGDPSLYGAIREQMDGLDERGIGFEVVPGVSSLFGAVAALGAEYTVPGGSQTLIVSRVEGRTPVPPSESLASLARHGASMALFLSAGLLPELGRGLLEGGLGPDTPAAIVYKASWPDERVVRTRVGRLAEAGEESGIDRTALVLVGDFLERSGAQTGARSKLYDPGFSHGFRKA